MQLLKLRQDWFPALEAPASATKLLTGSVGVMVDRLSRNDFEQWQKLRWPGELPPVRVDGPNA